MLKPKRKIARQEIKKDPLLESIANIQSHWNTHKNTYYRYGTILVIGIVAIIFFVNRTTTKRVEADALFGRAVLAWDSHDYENAEFQFELLVDEYGNTPRGITGYYYLGLLRKDNEDPQAAIDAFEAFVKDRKQFNLLLGNAHHELARLYLKVNDNAMAEKHLTEAIELTEDPELKHIYQLDLSELLYAQNRSEEARRYLDIVLEDPEIDKGIESRAQELAGKFSG